MIDLNILDRKQKIKFALFCAKQALQFVPPRHKKIFRQALKLGEDYLRDKATKEECSCYSKDLSKVLDKYDSNGRGDHQGGRYFAMLAIIWLLDMEDLDSDMWAQSCSLSAGKIIKYYKRTMKKEQENFYKNLIKANSIKFIEGL